MQKDYTLIVAQAKKDRAVYIRQFFARLFAAKPNVATAH